MEKSRKLILKGKFLDGISNKPTENGMIEIMNKTISYVGKERKIDKLSGDINIIEGETIMPGMIDCHQHFHQNGEPDQQKIWIWTNMASLAIKATIYAKIELESGFTTVRAMGDPGDLGVSLRNAINEGIFKGPRILTCGQPLSITGGHGTHLPTWIQNSDFISTIFADGVEEVRKAVRYLIGTRVDLIKLLVTGGCMDISSEPGVQNYNYEEIDVAVREAHKFGRKVGVHVEGLSGLKDAIKAGVDTIEHGFDLNEEAIQIMKEKNIYLIPTLFAGHNIVKHGTESGIPEYAIIKAKKTLEKGVRSFINAYKNGVKIAMGSDIGTPFFPHGEAAKELESMVNCGMSNFDAILAVTKNASEVLGINDKVGTIEKGKMADLLVLNEDPLKDITILQKKDCIKAVIKEGDIILLR